jgi:nucleoside-diphosphate-sugar epimerase
VTILRPAATYNDSSWPFPLLGTGDQLIERIRAGRPVIVLGDGSSIWESSHRDDVARAFFYAAGNENVYGKGYNVTGDEAITWEAYYNTVAKVMGAPLIDFVHIPTDLLVHLAPRQAEWCGVNFKYNAMFDNAAAKCDLGYQYTITWEKGVERMVAYHKANNDSSASGANALYNKIIEKFCNMEAELVKDFSPIDDN